ncbi:Conserved_hypothetical protein [Hexamita inflata]|uniref:Uncharacterized protein n=1 Tax=Hexamita inflata TaxID=28002 RepID=A0ABP1GX95_9EUKA
MKSFLLDTPLCRSVYTEQTGIQGMFVGLESDKVDPQDPDLRKTFFYMKINQTLTNDWFGRYNMICVGEENSTGQFSGSNVTYGTFSQRIYDFGQYILRQESNITVSLLFRTHHGRVIWQGLLLNGCMWFYLVFQCRFPELLLFSTSFSRNHDEICY